MYESPFQIHVDLLINGWNASAQYLQSFFLSMRDRNKYKFPADEPNNLGLPAGSLGSDGRRAD